MRHHYRESPERRSPARSGSLLSEASLRSRRNDRSVFEQHPLITAKQRDFTLFSDVIDKMTAGEHLTEGGLRLITMITERMNRQQRSQFLESSEAIRQPAHVR